MMWMRIPATHSPAIRRMGVTLIELAIVLGVVGSISLVYMAPNCFWSGSM